ncbi:MAG TPA: glycosyltransferase family 4 protein, partial [Candidatus Krumholzibacteria bacterium]|nr:glycosyltransferase family 4 protein [Candidatus Krumholzibacteria bacterium]
PVIALAAGGALETVIDGTTGIFVRSTDPDAWAEVLRTFRGDRFDADAMRQHALRFDRPRYVRAMQSELERLWEAYSSTRRAQ